MRKELLILAAAVCFSTLTRAATVSVPFVGCNSDGQTGPMEAPKGELKQVQTPAEAAGQLAWYRAALGPGVLAPRGWLCLGVYGSGNTSGRYDVAQVIARVFPAHKAFVDYVIKWFPGLAAEFPLGPYPTDTLIHKSPEVVEYETPAGQDGLGTHAGLLKNSSPIQGVAILVGKTPDLLLLAVRLPDEIAGLSSAIIQQTEHDAETESNAR